MSDGKNIKFYKNPSRKKEEFYKPYVPQYQLEGKDPVLIGNNSFTSSNNNLPLDNPRAFRAPIRPLVDEQTSTVPNIGNNMEHSWSAVNGEITDDLELDPNHSMIDNNDYVGGSSLDVPIKSKEFLNQNDLSSFIKSENKGDDLFDIVKDLEENSYLLIVDNTAVCSGPMEEIQEQATALVFGDHELCNGENISPDRVMIIKKSKIKIGLFLE